MVDPGRHVTIQGIKLVGSNASEAGPVASEDWTISLEGGTLRWGVKRKWLRAGEVNSDRTPALVLQPSFLPAPTTGGDSCGGDGPADLCTETQMCGVCRERISILAYINGPDPPACPTAQLLSIQRWQVSIQK